MTDTETSFAPILEAILASRRIEAARLPVSSTRTPDYIIDGKPRGILLEMKIKSDDPDDISQSAKTLASGEIASRSQPLTYKNTVSGVISDGADQMLEHDISCAFDHVLWLHASGHDVYAYEEQLRFTLYGVQRLFSSERPELIHCYFFRESEFWRYRKSLAGAFVSRITDENVTLRLCINPYYVRRTEFSTSMLVEAFSEGLLDVEREVDGIQVLLMDGETPRRDSRKVLEYLRAKYGIEDLQTFDLGFRTAAIRTDRP